MDIDNAEFMEEFMEDMIKHLKIMNDVLTKFKKGKLAFRVDKLGSIHAPIGKVDFDS